MANYYIDYTNGNDARTGLRIPTTSTYTVDTTADTTHFVDASLIGADDYINGSYVYNVTRSIGALITDFVAATDTVTLGSAIAGMTAGDTYYILDSWKTINQYTTTTARTEGDIAYIRANMVHTQGAVDITFDEWGTPNAYISIIGCDATTNDPWHDASNTLPTIDFADGAYQMTLAAGDDYWYLERLNIIQSADTLGNLYINASDGTYIKNCTITDNSASSGKYGINVQNSYNMTIDGCTLKDNIGNNIRLTATEVIIKNCTIDGGAATTDYGVYAYLSPVLIVDTTFGSTTAHDLYDVMNLAAANVKCRNCTFNKTTQTVYNTYSLASITSEDDDGTFGNQVTYYYHGTVTRLTAAGSIRSGGATSSAQLMPASSCGLYNPLSIAPFDQPDFAIYNTSTSPLNVDVYIRADNAWVIYPTAAELYTEASYLNNAASASRATAVSTAVLADGTTWVRFRTTMTPARAGFIYIKVYLKLYVGEGILVDILPVIS